MTRNALLIPLIAGLFAACSSQPSYRDAETPPATVGEVDLSRYEGMWYEIARYPNRFEDKGAYTCVGVKAEYAQQADGKIKVTNSCRKDTLDGEVDVAEGVARVVSPENDRLKVKFAPAWVPFASGHYWILDLTPDYSAALVGSPDGKYLWILSRTPTLAPVTLNRLMKTAREQGFDTAPLQPTPQPPA